MNIEQENAYLRRKVEDLELRLSKENGLGEKHHKSKLTDDDIHQIRILYDERINTLSLTDIARKFDITKSNVVLIGKRKTWKHVK